MQEFSVIRETTYLMCYVIFAAIVYVMYCFNRG